MRVAVVAAGWEVDSAEWRAHVGDLATALVHQGHQVVLYVRRTSPEQVRTHRGYLTVPVPAGPPRPLSRLKLLTKLDEFATFLDREWTDRPPDVAHLHSVVSGLAVRTTTVPLVQTYHGLIAVRRDRRTGGDLVDLDRIVGKEARLVLALDSEEEPELIRMGVPRSRVFRVPAGVDTTLFHPDGPVAPRTRRPRLLGMGDTAPHNGLHTVIDALPLVPDAELVIAGGSRAANPCQDPEVSILAQHAEQAGVAGRVRFVPPVHGEEAAALLRSADLLVSVPWHGPTGITALQAMACGTPVVASAVGVFNDLVVDGVTGSLVPPRDPSALGRAIRDLLTATVRRDVHAAAAADHARTRYAWDRIAAETTAVYERARATPLRIGLATAGGGTGHGPAPARPALRTRSATVTA
jgi:glycosyltransferase involved in cell wall biosynthesis